MITIWRFPCPTIGLFEIEMPEGAEILCFQAKAGAEPCLWALVDSDAPKETVMFRLAGTGHPLFDETMIAGRKLTKDDFEYIGTTQVEGGAILLHLFRVKAEKE